MCLGLKPTKVRYVGATDAQVQWGSCDDPRPLLTPGQEYKVFKTEVHSWHTKIILTDFLHRKFNSVHFEDVITYPNPTICEKCNNCINMDSDNVSFHNDKYYHTDCYNELFSPAPCPFCGSKDLIVESKCMGVETLRKWWVYCFKCKCDGPFSLQGEQGAICHWNKRNS